MSENPTNSNSNMFTGLFVLMFVGLAFFMGHKFVSADANTIAENSDENSDVVAIDESNETIEVTAEKFVPNEDDAEDDVEEGIVITGSPPASEE